MPDPIEQQIFESINKASRVLVALPAAPNGDGLGAGLALHNFLRKLDKDVEVACASANLDAYKFLPGREVIKNVLQAQQSFVVSLKTGAAELDELSYEVLAGRVDIFLKPKKGRFTQNDVSFRNAKFPYDLIFVLDTPALEQLGAIYEKNTDLFFETPIVNIDHHPNNEQYGEINLVDLTATSTAEILAGLITDFEVSLIDESIATNLLAGIIVETNSFQHVKTTPRAFLQASQLVSLGARQQEIIRELYKTKNVSLLKLWGRALARIREVDSLGLAYSLVNVADLEKSGASAEDISGVMVELVATLAGRRIIIFLAEVAPQEIVGYFHIHPTIRAPVVAAALSGQMQNGSLGSFKVSGVPLLELEKEILAKLERIKREIVV